MEAARAGGFSAEERRLLAMRAFRHTASYDVAVATWFAERFDDAPLPDWRGETWTLAHALRYGENPHQRAALYLSPGGQGLAQAEQLGGKEMSYNNYQDTDAAIRAAYDHARPAVAVIKHANPCGIAVGDTVAEAHLRAHACDPVSAYGGVIAANREVDATMAAQVKPIFTEVIAAPSYAPEALDILRTKKNLRILRLPAPVRGGLETRPVSGGLLVQETDTLAAHGVRDDGTAYGDRPSEWTLVAGDAADPATLADLEFAWRAVRAVKSNAILLAAGGASVGVGMGQVNRVDSARLAVERANAHGERARGAVAASDAFFPFADGLAILLDAGVRAVVAPGGSIRDDEVMAAAEAAGVTMYFTGSRHFFH